MTLLGIASRRAALRPAAALLAALTFLTAGRALSQSTTDPEPAGSDSSIAAAQDEEKDPLSLKNLIGSAVSLSNQKFPDVDSAIQRFRNNDVEGAYEFLKLAVEKTPKLPPAEVILAKMQLLARNIPGAAQWLEQAVFLHPEDPEAYLLLADQSFGSGRTAESEALFEKTEGIVAKYDGNAKRKRDFEIRILAGKSAVLERRQKWDGALALLKQWSELDPDSAPAHQRLGVVLFRLEKEADALKEFEKVRDINPDANHPNVFLGQLYSQSTLDNKTAKAKENFEKAYKAEPNNAGTAAAYAEWLVGQDDLENAAKVASALRKSNPESVGALLLDGIVAHLRKQPKQAEEALMKVLTLEPNNVRAVDMLALILIESDKSADREKALSYAQGNARMYPNSAQANFTLAWVYYQLNRAREGQEALQRGAQASGGQLNADSAYLVARIMLKQNQKEQALSTLKQLLDQKNSAPFLFRSEAKKLLKQLEDGAG